VVHEIRSRPIPLYKPQQGGRASPDIIQPFQRYDKVDEAARQHKREEVCNIRWEIRKRTSYQKIETVAPSPEAADIYREIHNPRPGKNRKVGGLMKRATRTLSQRETFY